MMAVDVDLGPPFMAGKPRRLFPDTYVGGDWKPAYDVGSDGHFLMIQQLPERPVTQLNVILNWVEELKERVPVP